MINNLPPKFDRSAVRSERLKVHWICSNDLEFPAPPSGPSCNPTELAASDVNDVYSAEVSTPIPDMSDAVNGKWPLDVTDVGLRGISDMDEMALLGGTTGAVSAALFPITILQEQKQQQLAGFFNKEKTDN